MIWRLTVCSKIARLIARLRVYAAFACRLAAVRVLLLVGDEAISSNVWPSVEC
jgi:hypothetical protein